MAVQAVDHGLQRSNKPTMRPNSLAEMQYNTIVKPDAESPSEEDNSPKEELEEEEVQAAIGVSIGHEQSRLTSAKTPAAEKAAAMEDLDGGALFDGAVPPMPPAVHSTSASSTVDRVDTAEEELGRERSKERSTTGSSTRLPSPWKAGARRNFMRSRETRASIGDAFGGRRRASSSSATSEMFKRMMATLPSMPKSPSMLNFSMPNFSFINDLSESKPVRETAPGPDQTISSPIPQNDGSSQSKPKTMPLRPETTLMIFDEPPMQSLNQIAAQDPDAASQQLQRNSAQSQRPSLAHLPPRLRRSASHDSAMAIRTLSRASSLGDDTRFENVSEQVNSRLKAIKDSWQDSNFKMPSFPTMPKFDFSGPFGSESSSLRGPGTDAARSRGTSLSSTLASRKATHTILPKSSNSILGNSSATALDSQVISHPYLSQALQDLTGDLVVMGGYRGSILRSAEPPHRQLWVPVKVGLNLRKVDLEVGLEPEDEESMEERIIPGGMLKNIGPVDMGKRLLRKLKHCENVRTGKLRVHDYGYDWRLSPHLLSRKLNEFLAKLKCNQKDTPRAERGATIIAHSLGGLITRHAVNQRPELFAGVVYAGSPNNCVNILGPLRNGDDVLLSSRVLTAQVNFTLRTSFALLPLEGRCFIDKKTREEYRVDFFNAQDWIENRFSPCISPALPPLTAAPGALASLMNTMASVMPNISNPLSSRKNSNSETNAPGDLSTKVQQAEAAAASSGANRLEPQMGSGQNHPPTSQSVATTCTIPYPVALKYLTRVLAETKAFKLALAHRPEYTEANRYPPVSVIYGKSTPTVYGAKVDGRDGIKRADAYDELAFASGDGVVLARAAQLPDGYVAAKGGVVSTERGHVTLLSDLEAVGRCLIAVMEARRRGVGLEGTKA